MPEVLVYRVPQQTGSNNGCLLCFPLGLTSTPEALLLPGDCDGDCVWLQPPMVSPLQSVGSYTPTTISTWPGGQPTPPWEAEALHGPFTESVMSKEKAS